MSGRWPVGRSPSAVGHRRAGWHEIDHYEPLSLLAELALGLAGFTGVVAAFGGRERAYSQADRARLIAIFLGAGSVLAGSLCAWILRAVGLSPGAAFGWSGLAATAFLLPLFFVTLPSAYALARDPEATTSPFIAHLGTVVYVSGVALFAGNFMLWETAWPLLTGCSIQLGWGLVLFARILIYRN